MAEERHDIQRTDIALENIKQILIIGLGIEIEKKSLADPVTKAADAGMPTVSFTTEEKEAWIKAGMPNINEFLKERRNGN